MTYAQMNSELVYVLANEAEAKIQQVIVNLTDEINEIRKPTEYKLFGIFTIKVEPSTWAACNEIMKRSHYREERTRIQQILHFAAKTETMTVSLEDHALLRRWQ